MAPPPRRSTTDAQLQALVAVADAGSFTGAARRLGMSQSAVSHAVTALEETLRVSLLERSARGVQLTPIGEQTVLRAREVLRLKELIWRDAEASRGLRDGVVRVGSFGPTASRHLLPPILKSFAERYPDLTVRVMEGSDQEVEEWLHRRKLDIGFVTLPSERFDTVHLAQDEMMVVLPAAHPLAARARIEPRHLADYPFIMSTGGCEPAVLEILNEHRLDVRYEIREVHTIVEMVANGAGLALKPALSLPDPLPLKVVYRPLEPARIRHVGFAVVNRRKLAPAVRAFFKVAGLHRQQA
jgi:DNA-binding transcriptional LysR family regulator